MPPPICAPSIAKADRSRPHDGARVRLREGTGTELIDMVRDDTIDVAVVSIKPDQLPTGATGIVIDHDDLILVGTAGHRLEDQDHIRVTELDGADLISFRQGAGLRQAADEVLYQYNVTPNFVIESNEMPVLIGLVAHGLGLAILPRAFVAQSNDLVWGRPLDPPIRPALALVWRTGRNLAPAAEAFLRHLHLIADALKDNGTAETATS